MIRKPIWVVMVHDRNFPNIIDLVYLGVSEIEFGTHFILVLSFDL